MRIETNKGRIDCCHINGCCHDLRQNKWYQIGQTWETRQAENNHLLECKCSDRGDHIRVDCSSGKYCRDRDMTYKPGLIRKLFFESSGTTHTEREPAL